MVLVGEDDFAVDLVGEDPQVVALSQPHQLPHQRLVVDLAGGVGGRAEQHQFRLFADQAFDLVEIGQEVVLGAEIVKDRLPVDDGDGHVVVGPAGVGQEHLVAGLEQGQEGTGHAHYRAGGDEDVLRAGRAAAARSGSTPALGTYLVWPALAKRQVASMICAGVSKSGWPTSRWMTSPVFSAAQARSMTSRMPERGISAGMRANGFI